MGLEMDLVLMLQDAAPTALDRNLNAKQVQSHETR
jgi:hypothetical protein